MPKSYSLPRTRITGCLFSYFSLSKFLSFIVLVTILFSLTPQAYSAQVTLAWDPNTEPDLDGYMIYYKEVSSGPPYNGTGATEDDSPIDVGNVTEFTLHGLTDGVTYFFAVTAYDTEDLESGYSNEVSTTGTSTLSVTSITSSTDNGSYKAADTVNITINFSEAVTLAGGSLIVALDTGRTVERDLINSQTSVALSYTVQAGDESSDLNAESLELSEGATLQNDETLDCNLSLPTGSNLADNNDIVIDAVAPASSATAPNYGNAALSITWTASDATSGVASTQLWYKGPGGTWANTGLAAQTGTSGTFSYTPQDGDGTYYFATRSTDNAGNREAQPSGNGDDSTVYDTIPPGAPMVSGTTPTNDTTPTWSWSSGGGGNGTYRYKLDNSNLSSGATQTTSTSYTPGSALSEGSHTLYVQERDAAGNWSSSGSFTIVIDITAPGAPVITTDGGNGPANDYTSTDSSITLNGTCAADTVAIYVNGSTNGVAHIPGETSWSYTGTLDSGENIFTITAEDAAGNVSNAGSITVTYGAPVGGYSDENVIPAAQISQSSNGDGIITIRFKIKDPTDDPCTLHTFQYSVDGGNTWNVPTNGDSSQCLSSGWQDNDGDHYSSAAGFDGAEEHSFTFTTKHGDLIGLNGTDQSDVRVRFTVSDGSYNSLSPVTSESFLVDNLGLTVEISYSEPGPYADADTITVTTTFTDAKSISGTPQIAIDYAGTGSDIPLTNMTATTDNKVWTYQMDVPSGSDEIATITITGSDAAGNPVGAHSGNTFTIDNTAPYIQNYPTIDHSNNTVAVTYSETDMQNAMDEANYRFSPSLNFATDGDDITNSSGDTYHLTMASIPSYTIFTLTASNITDAEGNPVFPSSIRINDNDSDDMPDDWETAHEVDDPYGDPDLDDLDNLQEYNNNTNPNYSDTDGDSLPDAWEVTYGLDPVDSGGVNGSDGDFDNDGWTNYEEYVAGTDPADETSFPAASAPEIVETIPHCNAGINGDTVRIPNDTSFCVWIEDSDGIDITDLESITFTISDGVNETYTRDLGDEMVVRVVKLTEDEDAQVTKLWAVYDRSKDDEYGNNYAFDSTITVGVDVKDRTGILIDPAPSYTFKIEPETQHHEAHDPYNLPDTGEVHSDDPDLEDPQYVYDAGIQVNSGHLEGAKITYNSKEPVTPRLGPTDEIPSLAAGRSAPMNLQPPTVFNTPVKVFIPYPRRQKVDNLHIYLYKAAHWVRACDNKGEVQPDGEAWMLPGSRVNHNNGNPSTIEIKIYHFSAVQAKPDDDFSSPPPDPSPSISDNAPETGGGCFIATAAFASNMDRSVDGSPRAAVPYGLLPIAAKLITFILPRHFGHALLNGVPFGKFNRASERINLPPSGQAPIF